MNIQLKEAIEGLSMDIVDALVPKKRVSPPHQCVPILPYHESRIRS